jgi:hypothetical protein
MRGEADVQGTCREVKRRQEALAQDCEEVKAKRDG